MVKATTTTPQELFLLLKKKRELERASLRLSNKHQHQHQHEHQNKHEVNSRFEIFSSPPPPRTQVSKRSIPLPLGPGSQVLEVFEANIIRNEDGSCTFINQQQNQDNIPMYNVAQHQHQRQSSVPSDECEAMPIPMDVASKLAQRLTAVEWELDKTRKELCRVRKELKNENTKKRRNGKNKKKENGRKEDVEHMESDYISSDDEDYDANDLQNFNSMDDLEYISDSMKRPLESFKSDEVYDDSSSDEMNSYCTEDEEKIWNGGNGDDQSYKRVNVKREDEIQMMPMRKSSRKHNLPDRYQDTTESTERLREGRVVSVIVTMAHQHYSNHDEDADAHDDGGGGGGRNSAHVHFGGHCNRPLSAIVYSRYNEWDTDESDHPEDFC